LLGILVISIKISAKPLLRVIEHSRAGKTGVFGEVKIPVKDELKQRGFCYGLFAAPLEDEPRTSTELG
jgi:hypothetical protein